MRRLLSCGAIALSVVVLVLVLLPPLQNAPLRLQDERDGTTVDLQTDRSWFWLANGCFTATWQVEGTKAVYWNGEGTTGSNSAIGCLFPNAPGLTVVYQDDSEITFQPPIRVVSSDAVVLAGGFVALLLLAVGLAGLNMPHVSPWLRQQALALRSVGCGAPADLSPAQQRLGRVMGYMLALLCAVFVVALIGVFSVAPAPTLLHIGLGLGMLALGIWPRTQHLLLRGMQQRAIILLPLVLWLAGFVWLDKTGYPIALRSTIAGWHTTLFFWLGAYMLAAYVLRSFALDRARRFAYITLTVSALIVTLVSIPVPYLYVESSGRPMNPDGLPEADPLVPAFNTFNVDVEGYVWYSQSFPFIWRSFTRIVHRPVYFIVSSQACRLVDMVVGRGYTNMSSGCSRYGLGVWGNIATNALVVWIAGLILYELVRAATRRSYAAWVAAQLVVLSAFNVWYVGTPSTDHVELLIALVSLWLLWRLFTEPPPPGRLLVYGILLGLLLLIKVNGIFIIFGCLLTVILRRWRLLPTLAIMPLIVFALYTQWVGTAGIPYMSVETGGPWATIRWLWISLPTYTPFEAWKTAADWIGFTMAQTAFFFGGLLIVGVFALVHDDWIERRYAKLAWLLFLACVLFGFISRISYQSHVVGLAPFLYGAVGVALEITQAAVRKRVPNARLAYAVGLLLLLIVIGHNLVAWGAGSVHGDTAIIAGFDPY